MEPERLYDDVIVRYLLREADPDEERFVINWMKADEKNRLYVESLRNTLQLVAVKQETEKVDLDDEWKHLQQLVSGAPQTTESSFDYYTPDRGIQEGKQSRRAKVYKILLAGSVAASVIFLIGLSAGWFSSAVKTENIVGRKEHTPEEKAKIDPLMAVVHHEVNTSGKSKQFLLPDGSAIILSDSSELTYKEPASGDRRDVYLVGNADFTVAKNKAKPFTVFSETVSTTAIGTKFTVTAKERENFIRVRLYEGKVVIKSLNGYSAKWTKEIYLKPGQELVYDKSRKTATVASFLLAKQAVSQPVNQTKDSPSIPHYNKGSWFMFNNQSLSEVFDALADMYDAKIVYARKDIKNMYFIGTYDKADSLEKILKQIALLNNLKLTKQNDTFRIEKQTIKK
jgi:transmembrane sensor